MGANADGVSACVHTRVSPDRLAFATLPSRITSALLRPDYIPILAVCAGAVLLGWFLATQSARIDAGREEVVREAVAEVDILSRLAVFEIQQAARSETPAAADLLAISLGLPRPGHRRTTTLILSDAFGTVLSAEPPLARAPRNLSDLFAGTRSLPAPDGRTHLVVLDGMEAVATVRRLESGHLTVVQPLAGMMAETGRWGGLPLAVALVGSLLLGGLGVTSLVQARRVRLANLSCARLKRRMDTSLARGRCGLWDWDIARGRVFWSSSMYELLGYDRRDDDLTFGELNAIIHPSDGDLHMLAEKIASSGTCHVDHDFRARTAAGQWMWLRARAEEIIDPDDGSRHVVGIAVDITDERGLAEITATADLRLREAIEAIPESFVLWDADARLVLCNSKFRKLHELPAGTVMPGMTYTDIVEAGRAPGAEHGSVPVTPLMLEARTREIQLSNGRWLHIDEHGTRDGGFVSIATDITALKQHEEQLMRSESRLVATISDLKRSRQTLQMQAQQLADLAERYLEQKAQAESANRAKTEFLAKMSHELRTPLTAIIGFAEVMKDEMFGPLSSAQYIDYCRGVHVSGRHLLSIIEDILQMSEIESGKHNLSPGPVAIDHAVERAVASVADQARGKSITLSADIRVSAVVQADDRALHQILFRLLQNSVKFTPAGGRVHVRVRPAAGAANIFVEDDGIGIPKDCLPRLGRPFEQVEPEFCRGEKGSGLGLALAKALSEMHGGGLRIRSQPGEGTIVMVHLPVTEPAANDRSASSRLSPMRLQAAG